VTVGGKKQMHNSNHHKLGTILVQRTCGFFLLESVLLQTSFPYQEYFSSEKYFLGRRFSW